jgi:hypothetical protein
MHHAKKDKCNSAPEISKLFPTSMWSEKSIAEKEVAALVVAHAEE